ncbi:MAG: Crp/Fnr family transcriptional regulator [Alphaproteobacteria bacterium]|nr:Crp/Fnr family transcriptional regulator [Alphaproteobacteria bacterium]
MRGTPLALSGLLRDIGVRHQGARSLRAGQSLFRQGDKATAIFEVERGRIQLLRHTADGRRVILFTAGAGQALAEAALFSPRYHCDGVAAADACVRFFRKEALLAAFRKNPDLAERFMALLARQVQSLRAQLEVRNIRSARERILRHLSLAARGDTVLVDGTLKDLASTLGLTHEALYRTMAALERDGAIRRKGRAIRIAAGGRDRA